RYRVLLGLLLFARNSRAGRLPLEIESTLLPRIPIDRDPDRRRPLAIRHGSIRRQAEVLAFPRSEIPVRLVGDRLDWSYAVAAGPGPQVPLGDLLRVRQCLELLRSRIAVRSNASSSAASQNDSPWC